MAERKSRIVPIAVKINLIIVFSLLAGLGGLTYYLTQSLINSIDTDSRESMIQQAEILHTSIENFMMPGEAPLAVNFFKDLRSQQDNFHIALFRSDGHPAFSDKSTLMKVNETLGVNRFNADDGRMNSASKMPLDDVMGKIGSPPVPMFAAEQVEDRFFYQVYRPLLNLPKCTRCHGSDHTIRGVIDIRKDISLTRQKQIRVLWQSSLFFVSLLLILALILSRSIHRMIVLPVSLIGDVCREVTHGNFSNHVDLNRRDEIGELGDTVNSMVNGLHERYELSKYVSGSTLQSLKGSQKGEDINLTLFFSDIRGFTSYTETHKPEQVISVLNNVLQIQSEIIAKYEGDIDKFVGDEVMAVFSGHDSADRAVEASSSIVRYINSNSEMFDGLKVGIGINTGKVIMGKIGSDDRADFTVIGDHVNTAARLCSAAKKNQVILSDSSKRALVRNTAIKGPYSLRVKGKKEPLRVYLSLAGRK